MKRSAKYKFMQHQDFPQESEDATHSHFDALLFQPIIVGSSMLIAIVFQSALCFFIFSGLLWITTLFPRTNPFERLYDFTIGKMLGQEKLVPAPSQRRFMQAKAASLMLLSGITILIGMTTISYFTQAFIAIAFALLFFGKFCVGAYIFHLLTGNVQFANKTCPWSK